MGTPPNLELLYPVTPTEYTSHWRQLDLRGPQLTVISLVCPYHRHLCGRRLITTLLLFQREEWGRLLLNLSDLLVGLINLAGSLLLLLLLLLPPLLILILILILNRYHRLVRILRQPQECYAVTVYLRVVELRQQHRSLCRQWDPELRPRPLG